MKPSQIALLSLGGAILLTLVGAALMVRTAIDWSGPERPLSGPFFGPDGDRDADYDSNHAPGEMTATSHDFSGFDSIAIGGSWTVAVTRGDEWQVGLSHPENDLRFLDVAVRDGQLGLNDSRPTLFGESLGSRLTATVVMPVLESVRASGANQVTLSGFTGERLEVEVAGLTELTGEAGRYGALDLSVAGLGGIDLEGFVFTDAHVNLAGASRLKLTMDGGELTGALAGGGEIEYSGTVSREAVDIAGWSRVVPTGR